MAKSFLQISTSVTKKDTFISQMMQSVIQEQATAPLPLSSKIKD
jgi:hypothetical protein